MTHFQTAANADSNILSAASRTIGAEQGSGSYAAAPDHSLQAAALRTAFEYLQTAWNWLQRKRTQQLTSRRMRLKETISIGEKRCISIVQVDGTHFLIGSSPASVQLIAVLDKPQEPAFTSVERRQS